VLRQTDQPVWRATSDLRHCFQKIAAALEPGGVGSPVSVLAIRVNELLFLPLTLMRTRKPALDESLSSSRRTVELFLQDLRRRPEHLALGWSVPEMAESCGLGVTRFADVVRQLTNMTPLRFLNLYRLEVAASLLARSPRPSVTEVAQRCGFSSSEYFASVFARRYGCTPTAFRARSRQG
jgi:AraC-like DNA-binding protein